MPILSQLRAIAYLITGFAVAALILAWQLEKRHAGKLSERVTQLTQLRAADRQSYEAAQAQAQAKNKADLERIKSQQERISDEVVFDYQRELADLRLRAQGRANQGSAGKPGISGVPQTAPRADADGLQLSPDERLQAQEIELRLLFLQNWIVEQSQPK